MELTKEYFDENVSQLVSKNHLDQRLSTFATKKDVDKFVTKEGLDSLATKDDLKSLASKEELNKVNNNLSSLQNFIQSNMVTREEFDNRLDNLPTRADFAQLQSSVDGIAKRFIHVDQELQVVGHRLTRMESWIMKAAAKIGLEYKP
jgi:hypothetical protein